MNWSGIKNKIKSPTQHLHTFIINSYIHFWFFSFLLFSNMYLIFMLWMTIRHKWSSHRLIKWMYVYYMTTTNICIWQHVSYSGNRDDEGCQRHDWRTTISFSVRNANAFIGSVCIFYEHNNSLSRIVRWSFMTADSTIDNWSRCWLYFW